MMDPHLRTDFPYILRVTGGGFPPYNALAKIEVATGKHEVFTRPGGAYRLRKSVLSRSLYT
jgi:hypothetical protein